MEKFLKKFEVEGLSNEMGRTPKIALFLIELLMIVKGEDEWFCSQ